jgi:hypothetical protein
MRQLKNSVQSQQIGISEGKEFKMGGISPGLEDSRNWRGDGIGKIDGSKAT